MKLHLPKTLLSAVLAACVAPAVIAETVTVTTATDVANLGNGYTGIIVNSGGILDFGSNEGRVLADGITINTGGLAKYSGNNIKSFAPSTAVTINGGGELQLLGSSDGLAWGSGPTSVTLAGINQNTVAKLNTKGRITFATTINMNGYAVIGKTQDAVESGTNRACLDTWDSNNLVVSNQGNVIDLEIMLRKDFNISTNAGSALTINGAITRHASEETSLQSVHITGNGLVTFNGNYASRELHIGGLTNETAHTASVLLSGTNSNIDTLEVKKGATLTLDAGSSLEVKDTFTNEGTFNMNGTIVVTKASDDLSYTLTDETGSTTSGNGWLTSANVEQEHIVTGNGAINIGTTAGVKLTISDIGGSKTSTSVSNNGGVFSATFASNGMYIVGEGNTVVLSNAITDSSTAFTVLQGGTLNINGMKDGAIKDKDVILHTNSALINTGASHTTGNASFDSIVLKGNASVGQATGTSNDISLLAGSYYATTLNLNGNTLTKKGGGVFYITNSTISSGTIDIQSGSVNLRGASTINGTVFNVSEGATLSFTQQDGNAGGKSPAERGEIILNATGTGLIKADSDVNIVGATGNAAAVASAFAGTIEMTGGTLRLGNPDNPWQSHSATLDSATIKLSNGAAFRFAGDGLSVGSIHVAGNGTNVIESHETHPDAAGKGFSTGKLRLDSNVRMYSTWGTTVDIGELIGKGELRVWHKRSDTSLNLHIDSIHDYTGDIILGKDQDGTLTNPTRITAYIGAAGTTSSISGTISNYGTLNIGTAAAEGVTASTISLLSTIENGGTLSLSGNIILGMDMSKYTLAQRAEGGSYSYDDYNGFYTANGSSYYLVEGNMDNITLSTQQATLGENIVTLEKKSGGVVFENTNAVTSTEFFITKGELTRSALIQDTESTRVTDSTAFLVKGTGVLVLSANESMSADLITVEETGKVKLAEKATLTNANALANSVIGNGTIELSYDTTYNGKPNASTDFTGTTHITAGNFTINDASFGNKLVLDNGVNFRLNATSVVTLGADKELVLNGTTEVHQNEGATLTFNGIVSGTGTYDRRGGGTLTFKNSVTLGAFKQENTSGSTTFQGNSVTLGNLEVETQTLTIAAKTATIGVKGTTFSQGGSNHETGLYIKSSIVNIGNGTDATTVTTTRVEMGDNETGNGGTLNVKANAQLIVTGSDVANGYHTTGFLLGEWGENSTLNINGKVLSQNASIMCGDVKGTVTVENGGFLATKGFLHNKNNNGSLELTLKDGGEIVLGSTGITAKTITTTFGAGTVGISSDSSISKAVTLNSTTGTTFDTTLWTWADNGSSITKGSNGGTLTIGGTISGSGKLIKDGAGTLKLNAANSYTGGTEVKAGSLVAATGAALGKGNVTISGGKLEITNAGGGAKVVVSRTITDDEKITTSLATNTEKTESMSHYSVGYTGYSISNADVDVTTADAGTTISTRLLNVSLTNSGTGQLTATNGYNYYTDIKAINGNISLEGIGNTNNSSTQKALNSLVISEGKKVGAHSNWIVDIGAISNKATLTVAGAATFGKKATLNANLTLGGGALREITPVTLTLDGTGEDAAIVEGNLTLTKGNLTLSGDVLKALAEIEAGQSLIIMTIGESLIVDGKTITESITMDSVGYSLAEVFTNTGFEDYYLGFNYVPADEAGYSTVYIGMIVPEPTTATLSLLALAALAARRRRR